jgi:Bacterial Ig-like domain
MCIQQCAPLKRQKRQKLSKGMNMPDTPATGMDTDATSLPQDDGTEHYAGEMPGDTGSSELESSEASHAKAQAVALSNAAAAAKARYARLASPQAGPGGQAPQYVLKADSAAATAAQASRIGRTEAALAATTVIGQLQNQLQKSFPGVAANPIVNAAVPWTPVLLLKPAKRGTGIGALVADPRVWSAVAIAGLVIAPRIMNMGKEIVGVRITRYERELHQGSVHRFLADAFDDRGRGRPAQDITFTSSAPDIVEIDSDGVVKAIQAGAATITASVDGKSDVVAVRVVKAA